jgi:hypothetical protein
MTEQGWNTLLQEIAYESKIFDNNKRLEKMAKYLAEVDESKQILCDKGYSWVGLSLLETVKKLPDNWLPKDEKV